MNEAGKINVQELAICFSFLLTAALLYSMYTKNGVSVGWTAALLGVVLLWLFFGESISSIKASPQGGIEAQMRDLRKAKEEAVAATDEAKQTVAEAQATLSQLQHLSARVVGVALDNVMMTTRFDGYTDEEQERLKQKLISGLDELGVPEAQQEQILKEHWYKYIARDYVTTFLHGKYTAKLTPEMDKEQVAFFTADLSTTIAPSELVSFLKRVGAYTPARQEWLKDYEYFLQHHKHRRPMAWANRAEFWLNGDKQD